MGWIRNVIDRVPVQANGVMLTGALTRDARYLNANGDAGQVYDIRVYGDYVYAGGTNGLWIFDKALSLIGRCDTMAFGWDDAPYIEHLALSPDGNYLYVGGSGFGVAAIDVSDKSAPAVVFYDTYTDCEMLALQSPYLYVVDDFWHFVIYDISTPSTPVIVFENMEMFLGDYYTTAVDINSALSLGVFGKDKAGGLAIVALADPVTPTVVGSLTITPSVGNVSKIYQARLVGTCLVIMAADCDWPPDAGTTTFYFYSVQNPASPILLTTLTIETGDGPWNGWLRAVGDRYLIASDELTSQMLVIDSCA